MPRPHPKELRSRVVAAYEAGEGTQEELAVRFKVGGGVCKALDLGLEGRRTA